MMPEARRFNIMELRMVSPDNTPLEGPRLMVFREEAFLVIGSVLFALFLSWFSLILARNLVRGLGGTKLINYAILLPGGCVGMAWLGWNWLNIILGLCCASEPHPLLEWAIVASGAALGGALVLKVSSHQRGTRETRLSRLLGKRR